MRAEGAAERALALVAGRAEALVSAVVGTSALTRFANSRIHQNVTEDVASVTVTVALDGGRVARASTTRLDGDGLVAVVERALAAAALRPSDPAFPGFAPPSPLPVVDHWDEATAAATPTDRAATTNTATFAQFDDYLLREAALRNKVAYTTTMSAASAACDAILALRSRKPSVKALQEWQRELGALA